MVQIFLGLPNNLLSIDARCLHSNYTLWDACNMVDFYRATLC